MAGASLRISSLSLSVVILAFMATFSARSEDAPLESFDAPTEVSSETVPSGEIEARVYDIRTIRPSRSGRVYLFEKFDEQMPEDGKIFLLREGETPVMALRVLRTYSRTKRIAAKKLLPYSGYEKLERGSQYRAFEKVGNKVLPVPPSAEDLKDLKDLESGSTDELPPAGEAPPADESTGLETLPAEEVVTPPAADTTDDEDLEIREQAEEEENDHYFPNQFTMAVGGLPNSTVPGPGVKFSGGLLYARKLSTSLALEGGFYYYKSEGESVEGGITTNPSMTIIPMTGSLRYQWRVNDLWTAYIYGGLMYPLVASSLDASVKLLRKVQVVSPALGAGLFLQTGPNWYLRLNLGIDSLTAGVMLRY